MMSSTHRRCLAACLISLFIGPFLSPALAQDATAPPDSPFLDIQWNSPAVNRLLGVRTGVCQADANPDAAAVEYKEPGSWRTKANPSVLRAMFYLAHDYHGMGLNHLFSLRQDRLPSFDKRLAAPRPVDLGNGVSRVTADYAVFVPFDAQRFPKAQAGQTEVASAPGANSTTIYFRHAVLDPFDMSLLADQIRYYRLVGLSPVGQRRTPMDIESADVAASTLFQHEGRNVGLLSLSSLRFPGADGVHYDMKNASPWVDRLHEAYLSGADDFGEGMLWVGGAAGNETCTQWRRQQERRRDGQETATDRLLLALLKRAGVNDETGLWIIPKGGQ